MEEDTHSRRDVISMRRNNPPFAALLFFTIASGKLWYGLQDGSLDARSIVWMTVIVAELGVYVFLRLVGESLPPLGRMHIPFQMRQGVSVKDSYRHLHSVTSRDLQTEHMTPCVCRTTRTPPVTSKFCVGHAGSAKATVRQVKMPYVEEDTFTPVEAAKILRLSKSRVIQLITEGDLAGNKDEGGRWHIPQRAIHDRLGDRPPRLASLESREVGSGQVGNGLVRVRYPTMEFDEGQSRTEPSDHSGQSAGESGWTTTDVAASALGVTPRTVRRFIDRGDLEGRKVERGIVESWEVSIDSLYSLRDKRNSEGQVRRTSADKSATKDTSPDNLADVLRELSLRLEQRASSEAELRTRLELTERTESSLREERDRILADLERERERAEQERERAEEVQRDAEQFIQEREQAQEEARRLREELEAERSKGFWRRLLGG